MGAIFKNNATTTLSGSINDTQTSINVVSSSLFPVLSGGDYFYATMYEVASSVEVNIEIVKVTATSGTVWTIVRGQDGTSARARSGVGTCYIELRFNAASAQLMLQNANNLSDLGSQSTARTNLGLGTMATQNASSVAITGGTISGVTITGIDSATTIADNADNTKKVVFEVSGVSTATTRTLTIPNASGTIALTSDLSSYQPLDSDLTAFAALAANGLVARTGTGTVAVRAITQPAAGITVTNGDGVSGNPTLALANDLAAVEGISSTGFVRRTASDTWSASAIVDADVPAALTGKTYNALTLTSNATGFSVGGGTTSKTLTVSNTLTLAGTDGTTITLPSSTGTVPLNNQTFYIGTTAVTINRSSGALSLTGVSIDGAAGSATTATTATKATNLVGGNNTTLLGAIAYQSNTDTSSLLSPNVTTTKMFLSQTGTGTNGAAPVWSLVSKSDVGLGSVENTALSTWTGTSTITTLGTIATGTWNATTISIAKGGTGATTAVAAFDALSPATTLGDTLYHDGTDNVRLAGNTTTTRKFFRQTGTGSVSAAPAWDTLLDADLPSALTGKTYNALSLTAASVGFTLAGGTTSKTLTVSNTITLAGTDSSTLNIGAGGTLGSAAFTASTAYAPAAGSASITSVGTITSGTWTGSAIGISYGGTGQTSKDAAFDALSPLTTLGDLIYSNGTNNVRLAGNTTTSKRFLTQTGTGSVSAAPGWNALVDGDLPSALTGKTYNGLSLTAGSVGFSVSGGTTAKTLAVSNNLTLAGTDGATLNVGAGGTLGSAAFTASSAYPSTTGSGASGTWAIDITGNAATATSAVTATRSSIEDTRAAQRTPDAYSDYRASYEFTNQLTGLGDWHSAMTLKGWTSGYSSWQIIGPSSSSVHENFYLRSGNNSTWNPVRAILHSGNYNTYSPTLTGTGASGTWGIAITGNAASASAAPWSGITSKPTTLSGFGITDAASIGGNTFTAGQTIQGNLTFDGVLRRILGDFSNVTGSTRTALQTSTTNGGTTINALPNGSGNFANYAVFDSSDADNAGYGYFGINATDVRINTSKTGTGTAKPLRIYTNSTNRLEIGTDGAWGLAGANYGSAGQTLVSQGAGLPPVWGSTNSIQNNTVTPAKMANAGVELGWRNRLINGNMQIANRGTSGTAAPYTVDRWRLDRTGSASTTYSQTASTSYGGAYVLATSGSYAAGEYQNLAQRIERYNCADLVGKTVTVSFWAAGSTTAGSVAFKLYLNYANSADNFSATTSIGNNTISLTGTPTYFTFTFTNLPSGAANGLEVIFNAVQSGATGTISFNVSSVQLEQGATATPFEYVDVATQQTRCQRYFSRAEFYVTRYIAGAGSFGFPNLFFKTTLRSATPAITLSNLGYAGCSGATVSQSSQDSFMISATTGGVVDAAISGTFFADAEL